MRRAFLLVILLLMARNGQAAPSDAQGVAFFEQKIRPLLAQRCYGCHSARAKTAQGGLRLDSRAGWQRGGGRGPAILPGSPDGSLLLKAVRGAGGAPAMPPDGKLSGAEVFALTEWIRMGAPDPRADAPGTAKPTGMSVEQGRNYWAFQPLRPTAPPRLPAPFAIKARPRTRLDAFVLAKLAQHGMTPNPPADRRTLIRRASFDLIGLPPTPEEVRAFETDRSPNAWAKVVDRLLASPHYGERWGRHWLDLARFAESHGYEQDYDRPYAYQYRDFVIRALNADLPYDQFVRWQIAGDEIDPDNPMAVMATGFLAAGTHATQITRNQVEKERYDELDDMLATTCVATLGLTVGCARCHDHKYDPIPNRDYYRMLSTFTTTVRSDYDVNMDAAGYRRAKAVFDQEQAVLTEARKRYERVRLPQAFQAWFKTHGSGKETPEERTRMQNLYRIFDPEWQRLERQARAHQAQEPQPTTQKALICSEGVPAVRTHTQGGDFLEQTCFLRRGDPNQKEGVATQSFLQALMRTPDGERHWQVAPPPGWRTSYRRRALANWITDLDYGAGPLLARVIVNRLWQKHIGRGIVATPSDFGTQGERPTHPELLDWLASELVRNGWRLKPIHRLIMMSSVYRESDVLDPKQAGRDPENRLCWRHPRRRLDAEILRDSMLAVSGTLDTTLFGPGTLDENMRRRSLYFFVKRSRLVPTMTLFDAPNALQSIASRSSTTTAPQALLLMNSPLVRGYALGFAQRIAPDPETPFPEAVTAGYWLALSRPPSDGERGDALAFLEQQAASYRAAGQAEARKLALADLCQALMSLNEFVYGE
jgi:hypothetical protein